MSLSESTQEDRLLGSKKRLSVASPSSFGRPLSLIESIGSSTDEEGLADEDDSQNDDGSTQLTSPRRTTDLKIQINELLKIRHALAAEEDETVIEPSIQSGNHNSILLEDLPKLLAEYERIKGKALLNEEARPVLDQYIEQRPELVLKADSLLEMIKILNDTDSNLNSDKEEKSSKAALARRHSGSTSNSDTDISTEDDRSQSDSNNDEDTQLKESVHRLPSGRHFDFPRSQSESFMATTSGIVEKKTSTEPTNSDIYRRKKTTSDPSAPPLEDCPRSSSQSKPRLSRQKNGETIDKDVLRGKGKAKVPPSSWSNARPRPPAIARRNRRVSDISSNQSDHMEPDNLDSSSPLRTSSSQYSQIGMGTPSESFQGTPRQRYSSQPDTYKEQSSAGKFPRSISSASAGFVFPRANASFEQESGERFQSEGWDHISGDLTTSPFPRSPSGFSLPRNGSRPASPSLDETSYQNFNALSPFATPASPGLNSGRSAGRRSSAGRRREAESDEGDETMMTVDDASALKARLEAAHRQLSEKERQYDAVQHEHEMLLSRLQDELEETKTQMNARKREVKDSKARENTHMDTIATLEADFNKSEKALEMTRDHLTRAKFDYDDQIMETNRLRVKVSELQEEVQRFKTEERIHNESAKAWEGDREVYRKTIKELHDHVDEVEEEMRRLQEGERETRVVKEQMERMNVEMEDMRRGSSFRGSHINGSSEADGTMSKRLGSELAREIAKGAIRSDGADDTGETGGMAESDDSADATYLIQKIRKKTKVEGVGEGAPPPYNEAALEKQLSERLHPLVKEDQRDEVGIRDETYHAMIQRIGKRCTVIEESLKMCEHEHPNIAELDSVEEAYLVSSNRWDDQLSKVWEDWTQVVSALLAKALPLFRNRGWEGSVKLIKGKRNILTLLTTSLIIFAIGIVTGWLFLPLRHRKHHLYQLEDFGISKSLLFPESIYQDDTNWLHRFSIFSDGRPISRMPT